MKIIGMDKFSSNKLEFLFIVYLQTERDTLTQIKPQTNCPVQIRVISRTLDFKDKTYLNKNVLQLSSYISQACNIVTKW